MSVYLFRHGDVINPSKLLYGRLPGFHLDENGKHTIKANALKLKNRNITHIYSSPLERAVETSEIICDTLGLQKSSITIHNQLIEIDCRDWEGKPLETFLEQTDYGTDIQNQTSIEPVLDAGTRLLTVLKSIPSNQNAILVSHGDPIMGLVVLLTGDWSVFHDSYIDRGTYIQLDRSNGNWVATPKP